MMTVVVLGMLLVVRCMMAVVMMMSDGESQWTNARKSSGDDGHDDGSDHVHCGEIPARRKRHEVRARLHLQRHPAVVPALGCLREHRCETFASRRVAPRSGITSQEHEELTSCLQFTAAAREPHSRPALQRAARQRLSPASPISHSL